MFVVVVAGVGAGMGTEMGAKDVVLVFAVVALPSVNGIAGKEV